MTDVATERARDGAREPAGLSAAGRQVLRELTGRARAGGLKLTGEGGLPGRLTKMAAEGARDILGLWAGEHGDGEGAKFWLRVLPEIKNRGTRDVLMLVCDGLKGLPDAVNAVWEKTVVQARGEIPLGYPTAGSGHNRYEDDFPVRWACL